MKQLIIALLIFAVPTAACSLSSNNEGNNDGSSGSTQVSFSRVSPTPTLTLSIDINKSSEDGNQPSSGCGPRSEWFAYVVVRGDTLFSIARRANTSLDELAAANCLDDPTQISTGQTLYVPNAIAPGEEPRSSDELVAIYLIIPEDDGASGIKVGCGDSAISVWRDQEKTGDTATDLRASLEALFSIQTEAYGQSGLAHSLADTDVSVDNVAISGAVATIELNGDFPLSGVCADARMEAQIFLTVFQYVGINRAFITMNGTNLKQWFDMSGLTGDDVPYLRTDFGYLAEQ